MSEVMRVLQRGYELIWHEDRIEDALRGLGPDFEWIMPDHPEGARRQGPDAAIEFFRDWRGQFDDLVVTWELLATARDANEALRRDGVAAVVPFYTEDVV
jgi:hypothetical protein